jgi:hypothetical protein
VVFAHVAVFPEAVRPSRYQENQCLPCYCNNVSVLVCTQLEAHRQHSIAKLIPFYSYCLQCGAFQAISGDLFGLYYSLSLRKPIAFNVFFDPVKLMN